jgi:hypothetical protein
VEEELSLLDAGTRNVAPEARMTESSPLTDAPHQDDGDGRVDRLARRLHLTEGQLYTVVLTLLVVLLLLSSGLPGSGEAPHLLPAGTVTTDAP